MILRAPGPKQETSCTAAPLLTRRYFSDEFTEVEIGV